MAARVKKLFHRKKDDEVSQPQQSPPRRLRKSTGAESDSNVRHSLYENTVSGEDPERGQYPLKGNGGQSVLAGRRSSVRSQGHRASSSDLADNPQSSTHQRGYSDPFVQQDEVLQQNNRTLGPSLTQGFSGLNLRDGAAVSRAAPNTSYVAPTTSNYMPYEEKFANSRGTGFNRADTQDLQLSPAPPPHRQKLNDNTGSPRDRSRRKTPYSSTPAYDQDSVLQKRGQDISRRSSIPRKEVGAGFASPASRAYPTSPPEPLGNHSRQTSIQKPLPTPPDEPDIFHGQRPNKGQFSRNLDGAGIPTAEDIVSRAKGNTYDTEVVEKVAPAVIHETINREVHHIREEIITREIHHHDVYHRILPVIDVEVLPARHFLPVEGGGLVEVSADEVPSRGRNWVIAETASKIASDDLPPHKTDHFSARTFPGTEGDSIKYITPEGYERTEQTWIHPPELETGARDSGQSWPMEFGKSEKRRSGSGLSGKHPRAKSPKKQSTFRTAGE